MTRNPRNGPRRLPFSFSGNRKYSRNRRIAKVCFQLEADSVSAQHWVENTRRSAAPKSAAGAAGRDPRRQP